MEHDIINIVFDINEIYSEYIQVKKKNQNILIQNIYREHKML